MIRPVAKGSSLTGRPLASGGVRGDESTDTGRTRIRGERDASSGDESIRKTAGESLLVIRGGISLLPKLSDRDDALPLPDRDGAPPSPRRGDNRGGGPVPPPTLNLSSRDALDALDPGCDPRLRSSGRCDLVPRDEAREGRSGGVLSRPSSSTLCLIGGLS